MSEGAEAEAGGPVAAWPSPRSAASPVSGGIVCVHCGCAPVAPHWLCGCSPAAEKPTAATPPDTWGPMVPADLKALVRDWLGKVREGRNAYSIAAGCRREIEVIVEALEPGLPPDVRKRKGWWADVLASLGDPPKPGPPGLAERIEKLAKGGLLTTDFIVPAKTLDDLPGAAAGPRLHVSPDEAETAMRFLIALILVHYEAPSWFNGR